MRRRKYSRNIADWIGGTRGLSDRAYRIYDDAHRALLAFLKTLKGAVVLSGYAHPIYDDALGDWRRIERLAHADGARERTKVLWIKPSVERSLFTLAAG